MGLRVLDELCGEVDHGRGVDGAVGDAGDAGEERENEGEGLADGGMVYAGPGGPDVMMVS